MNVSRTTKILGFSVPPALQKEVEEIAKEERRTKSELFREMLRIYKRYRTQRERDEDSWVMQVIRDAEAEKKTDPMSQADILRESDRSARYGATQAKKLGIKPGDIDRIMHEHRARKRS